MMKRISVMLTAVVLAVTAMGYSIPSLQTSGEVQLNRWVGAHGSGMLTKAFAKAKAENRPILMGFINHTSSGGGCSHCAEWINKCILTSAWNNYIATRPMVLIMFNLPDLGESKYMNYYFKYINPNGGQYPGIALYNANGSKNQVLNNTNVYKVTYKHGDQFRAWLTNRGVTEAVMSSVQLDSTTKTVSEAGTLNFNVTRSGKSGNVTVTLTASKGTISPSTYTWTATEGAKSFTYTPVANNTGYDRAYNVTVTMRVSSTVQTKTLGSTTKTITVKDKDVKMTLAEFIAANPAFSGLTSTGDVDWFVDQNNVLRSAETANGKTASLEFEATDAGTLTAEMTVLEGTGTVSIERENAASGGNATTHAVQFTGEDTGGDGEGTGGDGEGTGGDGEGTGGDDPPVVAPEVTAVIEAIDAIGEVVYTDECKGKIDAAREAYDALTDEQKEQVTNYETLTTAEAAYSELAVPPAPTTVSKVIGLSDNEVVKFTGTSTADGTIFALSKRMFTAFAKPVIKTPMKGAAIQLDDLKNGKKEKVDFSWTAVDKADGYRVVTEYGGKQYGPVETDGTTLNALDNQLFQVAHGAVGEVKVTVYAHIPSEEFDEGESWVDSDSLSFYVVDKPIFVNPNQTSVSMYTKVAMRIDASATSSKKITYSATGLKAIGLKIDPATGIISGTPTKSGTFTIKVTATTSDGSSTRYITLVVSAAKTLKSKVSGLVFTGDSTLKGTVEMTVSTVGKFKAKLATPSKKNVSGTVNVGEDGKLQFSGGGLSVKRGASVTGVWTGTYNGMKIVARDLTTAKSYAGLYTATLMNDNFTRVGFTSMKVLKTGKLHVKGTMPNKKGASVSTSAFRLSSSEAAAAGIAMPNGVSEGAFFPIFKTGSTSLRGIGVLASNGTVASPGTVTWKGGKMSATMNYSGGKLVKSFSAFAGKTFKVYKGGAQVASYRLTSSFGFSGVKASVAKTAPKPNTDLFTAKVKIGGKVITMKGAAAPKVGRAAAVGAANGSYYYGVVTE
ncbi:MAG: putative Ig domain-containing protein [Kiritimatiellae bacterium]|nr:putative Ig domain-containing protein [Kiritimatiellia bacterium]